MRGLRQVKQRTWLESPGFGGFTEMLYGQIGAGTAVASHTEISAFRERVPVSFSTMWFNPFTLVSLRSSARLRIYTLHTFTYVHADLHC